MDAAKLREIVEPNVDTKASRSFDLAIQFFILISLVDFTIGTLPDLSPPARRWLRVFEIVTVTVFTVEYALRIILAERKLRFVLSFYGIIDLLAILPFYLGLAVGPTVDLRALRIVRAFRLLRVLKMFRYSRALRHISEAVKEVKEELILYLMATAFLIFLASTGIYYFERDVPNTPFKSVLHALWWAVVTLTTVGYGDIVPQTVGGRVFTGLLLLIGIGTISVPSGLIATGLTKVKTQQSDS